MPVTWFSIALPMECAASLHTYISDIEIRLRGATISGIWVLVNNGLAAACARHVLWVAYEYHQEGSFCTAFHATIKVLKWSTFPGCQSNSNELKYLIFVIESVNSKRVPAANIR